jgi:hypothetical protein
MERTAAEVRSEICLETHGMYEGHAAIPGLLTELVEAVRQEERTEALKAQETQPVIAYETDGLSVEVRARSLRPDEPREASSNGAVLIGTATAHGTLLGTASVQSPSSPFTLADRNATRDAALKAAHGAVAAAHRTLKELAGLHVKLAKPC